MSIVLRQVKPHPAGRGFTLLFSNQAKLSCSPDFFLSQKLHKNQEFSALHYQKFLEKLALENAYHYCLRRLGTRAYATQELNQKILFFWRRHLEFHALPHLSSNSTLVLDRLKKQNLLNDEIFLETFVSSRLQKGYSRHQTTQKLLKLGFSLSDISSILDEVYSSSEQKKLLKKHLERQLARGLNPQNAKVRIKLIRHLGSRGFPLDQILEIIRQSTKID